MNATRVGLPLQEISRRRISDQAFYVLVILYSVLILLGAAGNSLVVLVVARKPTMRTARNMFILNLAISGNCDVTSINRHVYISTFIFCLHVWFIFLIFPTDLLLCLVTMPLTLIEIQATFWPFGTDVILCKLIETLRAVSIFVSTISITAIALDRYQVNKNIKQKIHILYFNILHIVNHIRIWIRVYSSYNNSFSSSSSYQISWNRSLFIYW